MCINTDPFDFSKSNLKKQMGHLAANPWQVNDLVHLIRHLAFVLILDDLSCLFYILCLFVVKSDLANPLVQSLRFCFQNRVDRYFLLLDEVPHC